MSAYDTARHFGFRVPAQTYRHTDKQTDRTTLLDILDLVYQHRHTDRQTDIRAGNTVQHSWTFGISCALYSLTFSGTRQLDIQILCTRTSI